MKGAGEAADRQETRRPVAFDPLRGKRVVLGVTGSIAAYKAHAVAARLAAAGAEVDVVLTRAARELVQPMSFRALTHRPVVTSLWEPVGAMALDHITLAHDADLLLVAPATAHTIARLALGLADDALTTTALATRAPLIVAPAMEPNMWSHEATRRHVETLQERGAIFVGPAVGRMASGREGIGRLVEPDVIVGHVRTVLARDGELAGRRLLITAGPTREPLDPVRFFSNYSTGRMGYELARAGRNRGAEVTLISGPTELPPPTGVTLVAVETALEMRDAVLEAAPSMDAVIMTAAVADFRPAEHSPQKISKSGFDTNVAMERNPDILVALSQHLADRTDNPVMVGFAAETDDVQENAARKRREKHLDLIVANTVPASFGDHGSDALLLDSAGVTVLGTTAKDALASTIVDRVSELLAARERS